MRIDNPDIKGFLGQVIQASLSATNAWTKSQWQAKGWAIMDGTTPTSQGITDPIITTTDDLQDKFLKASSNETSGTTGGSNATHNHKWATINSGVRTIHTYNSAGSGTSNIGAGVDSSVYATGFNDSSTYQCYTDKIESRPSFYEVVYLIKVK